MIGAARLGRISRNMMRMFDAPRAREASTNCGSFIISSAWSGVLVRSRRTTHDSRDGASRVVIWGGGDVRFQNVYMLRRCTLSNPLSATKWTVLLAE